MALPPSLIAPLCGVQQKDIISEDDIFTALERIHTEKAGGGGAAAESGANDEDSVTPLIRRTIATYMAAKALVGAATPDYDEMQRIVVTPGNSPTGYVYFIPQDAHLETEVVTRSFMEGHMVVRGAAVLHGWGPHLYICATSWRNGCKFMLFCMAGGAH